MWVWTNARGLKDTQQLPGLTDAARLDNIKIKACPYFHILTSVFTLKHSKCMCILILILELNAEPSVCKEMLDQDIDQLHTGNLLIYEDVKHQENLQQLGTWQRPSGIYLASKCHKCSKFDLAKWDLPRKIMNYEMLMEWGLFVWNNVGGFL